MAEGRQVCDVAVLSVNNRLPWRAAKWLYQNQVDFNYLEDWRLLEQAKIKDGRLHVANSSYRVLGMDQDRPLAGAIAKRVQAFEQAGGIVLHWGSKSRQLEIPQNCRDVIADPPAADLRVAHVRGQTTRRYDGGPQNQAPHSGTDTEEFYLFVNEGEREIVTQLTLRERGPCEWFDAWTGTFRPAVRTGPGRHARLGRREDQRQGPRATILGAVHLGCDRVTAKRRQCADDRGDQLAGEQV